LGAAWLGADSEGCLGAHMPCGRIVGSYLRNAALIVCLCIPFSTKAAEFTKSPPPKADGPDLIFIVGDFTLGDEKKFINVALNSTNAIVVFESPGGNLIASIEIGKAIHLKGFATFVPDTVQCSSACALAWLGGRVRYMSNTARVGFHAVYVENSGQAAVSSAGNALVGAYLNQLGLPTSAIIYITGAPPQGMQWLNFMDAQKYGIDVRPFNLAVRTATPPGSEPSRSSSSQVSSVKKEMFEFVDATNRSNDLSLAHLQRKYRDQVNYYGKLLPKSSVLGDKGDFFRKWPIRNYSVQPSSVTVTCESVYECKTDGVFDWNASNRNSNSVGSAAFSFLWTLEGNDWKISSENSRVIQRKITRLAPSDASSGLGSATSSSLPAYQVDSSGTKVISLSNLASDASDCHLDRGSYPVKVVKRKFDEDGLKLIGIVIEGDNGSREYVNVSVNFDKADMVTTSLVMNGLHTLLAEGRFVVIDVRFCGAAGRVQMIDGVREHQSLAR
jgi:hypothetical protein